MSDEVETMASAFTVPWHGIGAVVDHAMTAAEAIKLAGLNWKVTKEPAYALTGDNEYRKVEGCYWTMRSSDHKVLGRVAEPYVPFQNADAFAFMDHLVDTGDVVYQTAGALRGGKVVFVTMRVPQEITIAGTDVHQMYLVLSTSHDGTRAIRIMVTPVRVVCMNTLRLGETRAKSSWSMQHVSTITGKIQEARETLKLSFTYAAEFEELANKLVNTKLTAQRFDRILEEVIPHGGKTDEIIETIKNLYLHSERNGYTGTAWGGLNAITEFYDHHRNTRSQEAVFYQVTQGQVARIRDDSAKRLLALA